MADTDHEIMRWLDRPETFRAAVEFTAAETGFVPALIEKDFWCSLLLWRLFSTGDCPLVFKGGTLLSKAYAEKVRATLTRREPAPRDLYDLHHAVVSGVLNWRDEDFLRLAARKVATEAASDWLAAARIEAFRRGLQPDLRPVLRPSAFDAFDFTGALETMASVANSLKEFLSDQPSPPSP